jgi:hypothetical protein
LKHEPELELLATKEAEVLDVSDLQIAELEALLDESRDAVLEE